MRCPRSHGPSRPGTRTRAAPTRSPSSKTRSRCSPTPRSATGWPARPSISRRRSGCARGGATASRRGSPPSPRRTAGSRRTSAIWPRSPTRCASGTRSAPARPAKGGRASGSRRSARCTTRPTPATTWRTRPATAPTGSWSSSSSPRPTRACSCPRRRCGTGAPNAGRGPQELLLAELGRAALVIARCSPPRCARPGPRRWIWRTAAPTASSPSMRRLLADAGFGVQLPARLGRLAPGGAVAVHPQHPGRWRGHPRRSGPRGAGRFPLVGCRRRRRAGRGGDRRAGGGESAARAGARAVGERRCRAAAGGPGVPPPRAPRRTADRGRGAGARRGATPTTRATRLPLPVTAVHAEGWLGDLLEGTGRAHAHPDRPPARLHARSCAPTRSAGVAGWRSWPRSVWAPASPTTWAWARPSSCWRWRPYDRRARRAGPDAAAVPDVAGRHLAAGGRALRPRAAGARAPRPGPPARRRRCASGARGRRPASSPPTPPPPATSTSSPRIDVAPARARRGPGGQERRSRPRAGRAPASTPGTASRSPARPWRTGSPSCGR